MWTCEADGCGCKNIAAGLVACPMCGKECVVPKATSGGVSNAWEDPDAEAGIGVPVEAEEVPQDAEAVTADGGGEDTGPDKGSDPPVEEPPVVKPARKRAAAAQAAPVPEPESAAEAASADAEGQ